MVNEIIKILTFQKKHGRKRGSIGSSIIRGEWLAKYWPESSLWTEGAYSDVLIFQKVYWNEMMDLYPGIKILDLCDPDWLTGELELIDISKKVDAITCSSEGIYNFIKRLVDIPVFYIPDRIDMEFFKEKKKHEGRAKRVAWFGYSHNAKEILPMILPSLSRLNLDLIVISDQDFRSSVSGNVNIENKRFDWQTLKWDLLSADIILNPQPIEKNNRFEFKSQNKTFMAWALGLPVANSCDDMERFLDPDERKKEAELRVAEVFDKWNIKRSVEEFKNVIEICKKNREEKAKKETSK